MTLKAPFVDGNIALPEIDRVLIHLKLATTKDKKTKTNGGEFSSPCPLCKLDGGTGGNDRCVWWPNERPIFGAGSNEFPIFRCRICRRTGDLIGVMQKAYEISFAEALAKFEITEWESNGAKKTINTSTHLSAVTIPDADIMKQAWSFVEECVENLWETEDGQAALEYLIERGLRESTIRALFFGYNPELRYEDAILWGGSIGDADIVMPRGIVIPEIHVDKDGKQLIYSISIRRSNTEIEEYLAETGKKLAKYHVIRVLNARSLYVIGLKAGEPATLHEGQINAAVAWQESGYGAAATQSADGAQDNLLTTATFLIKPRCWLLCQESDEAGKASAKYWHEVIERSLIHNPPNTWDMDEYYLNGGDVKAFVEAGVKRFDRMWALKTHWTKVEAVEAAPTEAVDYDFSLPENVDQHPDHSEDNEVPIEGSTVFSDPVTLEGPLEDQVVSLHQSTAQEPSSVTTEPLNACYRFGAPAPYQDRYHNYWCGNDSGAYWLMQNGGRMSDNPERNIRFRTLYWPPTKTGTVEVPTWDENHELSMQEEACSDVRKIEMGREKWLAFCRTATRGDIWLATMQVRHILQGEPAYEPYRVTQSVVAPCARMECMHEASLPARHSNEMTWDKKRYKWPLVKPYAVQLDRTWVFCPHCATAGYLLELAKETKWAAWHNVDKVIEGEEEWLEYCATMPWFDIAYVFDPMRREYLEAWKNVQSRIYG